MAQYIIRRVLQAIPLLILVTIVVFVMLKLSGDPLATVANDPRITPEQRAIMRESLGLNDPIPVQFVYWLIGDSWRLRDLDQDGEPETPGERLGVLRGDLGESFRHRKPVGDVIGLFLPRTLLLGTTAYIVTVLFGLGIGIFAALRQYSRADNIITAISFITFSMPIFLIALLSVFIFAVTFKKLGLPYLPVPSLPVVTLMGLDIPLILSGAVVTETIFGWQGMGWLFISSLDTLDVPVVIILVLMTAVAVVVFQLLTDVIYAWLDPRIRYA
jgi:ABC-type dipeptide/oligopeptide/nickel transport system permease component